MFHNICWRKYRYLNHPPWWLPNKVQKDSSLLTCRRGQCSSQYPNGAAGRDKVLDLLFSCGGTEKGFPGGQGAWSRLPRGFQRGDNSSGGGWLGGLIPGSSATLASHPTTCLGVVLCLLETLRSALRIKMLKYLFFFQQFLPFYFLFYRLRDDQDEWVGMKNLVTMRRCEQPVWRQHKNKISPIPPRRGWTLAKWKLLS